MRRILTLIVALAGMLAISGAVQADQWNKSYSIAGHAQLRFTTNDGAIEIISADANKIDVRVETSGWRIGSSEVQISEQQTGDAVEIEVRVPRHNGFFFGSNSRSVRVYLTVPRESDLDVHSGDGDLTARDVHGNLRLDTGDGALRVDGLHGTLRFHTGDGHIDGSGLDGDVDADTGDGSVTLRGRFEEMAARTGDGNIELTAENGSRMKGPWNIHTGDGHVRMRLPNDFSADLDAHTGDGKIDLDFAVTMSGSLSSGTIRGKLGGGGLPLTIRSGDGSIYIEKL
ncbi:MAG TPA: DUF4097 family beta strand repeat-containing protein [Candidatus Acidoferrales bacterium]|nr:DUF4097 family beta strand repeat-containing protein [Candidatus Acidoferrales bacterium]